LVWTPSESLLLKKEKEGISAGDIATVAEVVDSKVIHAAPGFFEEPGSSVELMYYFASMK
jgi:hypothetical protein